MVPTRGCAAHACKKSRVGGPRAFPPFHDYDDQGALKGISADYLFTITDRIGLEVEVTGPGHSGYWNLLETYIKRHSDASFTHSMCPECAEQLYGDQKWYHKKRNGTPEG